MSEIPTSAVMIPEPEQLQPTDSSDQRNGLKRRQSDVSETESKRQRTGKSPPIASEEKPSSKISDSVAQAESPNTAVNATSTQKTEPGREERRKSGVADEKQRSKRLFGALLGNLNQPRDRTSKRRAEIEQRRKAELEKQDNERLEDKQKRLAKLAIHRRKEQIYVDERNMHTRHQGLLNAANMLRTKTEPQLYYRPWDLLSEDEDTITQQVSDTREQIDKEVADFASEKEKRLAAIRVGHDIEAEGETPATAAGAESELPDTDADRRAPLDSNDPDTRAPPTPSVVAEASLTATGDESVAASIPEAIGVEAEKPPGEHTEMEAESEKDANKKAAEVEAQRLEAEDEGDHVVEGDENTDTVIY